MLFEQMASINVMLFEQNVEHKINVTVMLFEQMLNIKLILLK